MIEVHRDQVNFVDTLVFVGSGFVWKKQHDRFFTPDVLSIFDAINDAGNYEKALEFFRRV